MPGNVKNSLLIVCISLIVGVICTMAPEGLFIMRFLKYAEGLDHKGSVLFLPVARLAAKLILSAVATILIVALARGKNWARISFIVMALFPYISPWIYPYRSPFNTGNVYVSVGMGTALVVVVFLWSREVKEWCKKETVAVSKWKN